MSENTITLIVIVCTGAVVAVLFFMIGKQKKKREQALSGFCRERGYAYSRTKKPFGVEVRIEGDTFLLTSRMVSQRQDTQTGTSSWHKETILTARGTRGALSGFALGSVPAAANWDALPDLIRSAAVAQLAKETGLRADAARTQPFRVKTKSNFLLFEETPGAGNMAVQKLSPLLESWPERYNLLISGSRTGFSLRAAGLFIEDAVQLERIVRLGEACIM